MSTDTISEVRPNKTLFLPEDFVRSFAESEPAIYMVPPGGLGPALASIGRASAEVLLDRATRKPPVPTDGVQILTATGKRVAPRGAKAAIWGEERHRLHSDILDLAPQAKDAKHILDFANKFLPQLGTPFRHLEPRIVVMPPGANCELAPEQSDLLLIHLGKGAFRIELESPRPAIAGTGRCVIYCPARLRLKAVLQNRAVFAKIHLTIEQFPEIASRYLIEHMRQAIGECELRGVLLDNDASIQIWDRGILPLEQKLKPAIRLAELAAAPVSEIPAEEPVAAPESDTAEDQIYSDREWNTGCISRRHDDIYISTYKRSGTTWMQMIMYQLLTNGDMDAIDHIYQFSPYPYLELRRTGTTSRIDSLASPRVIKSHQPFDLGYSKTGRYIYIARNGIDVAISSYYHSMHCGGGPVPFDVYFDRFLNEQKGWFAHVRGWWEQRNNENVLFLKYGDMIRDRRETIKKVADFCGIELPEGTLARAVERTAFDYMKNHESKLDSNTGALWLQQLSGRGFIRQGTDAKGRLTLSSLQARAFDLRYQLTLGGTDLNLDS